MVIFTLCVETNLLRCVWKLIYCTAQICMSLLYVTQRGVSALIYAADWGKADVVVELVRAGANLDLQNRVCIYLIMKKH